MQSVTSVTGRYTSTWQPEDEPSATRALAPSPASNPSDSQLPTAPPQTPASASAKQIAETFSRQLTRPGLTGRTADSAAQGLAFQHDGSATTSSRESLETQPPKENKTFSTSIPSLEVPTFISSVDVPDRMQADSQRIERVVAPLRSGQRTLLMNALIDEYSNATRETPHAPIARLISRMKQLPESDPVSQLRRFIEDSSRQEQTDESRSKLEGLQREIGSGVRGPYVNAFIKSSEQTGFPYLRNPESMATRLLDELRDLRPPAAPAVHRVHVSLADLFLNPLSNLVVGIKGLALGRMVTPEEEASIRRITGPIDRLISTGTTLLVPELRLLPLAGKAADGLIKLASHQPLTHEEFAGLLGDTLALTSGVGINKSTVSKTAAAEHAAANNPKAVDATLTREGETLSADSAWPEPRAPIGENLRARIGDDHPTAVPRNPIALGNGRYIGEDHTHYLRDGDVYRPLNWDRDNRTWRLSSASPHTAGTPIRLTPEGWEAHNDVGLRGGAPINGAGAGGGAPAPAPALNVSQLAPPEVAPTFNMRCDGSGVTTDATGKWFCDVDRRFYPVELDPGRGTFTVTGADGTPLPVKYSPERLQWEPNPTYERASLTGGYAEATRAQGRLLSASAPRIAREKFTAYALNPNHPLGKDKARVFESVLGFTQNDPDLLMTRIREGVNHADAIPGTVDKFGWRFSTTIPVTGPNGRTAPVTVAWIFKPGNATPDLTTAYVNTKLLDAPRAGPSLQ